jgi:hypothetical protein
MKCSVCVDRADKEIGGGYVKSGGKGGKVPGNSLSHSGATMAVHTA